MPAGLGLGHDLKLVTWGLTFKEVLCSSFCIHFTLYRKLHAGNQICTHQFHFHMPLLDISHMPFTYNFKEVGVIMKPLVDFCITLEKLS